MRKCSSCKKILRKVKKITKISLVHTNGKKECNCRYFPSSGPGKTNILLINSATVPM
jgi:hypothetical protein